MRKTITGLAALSALAFAGTAQAETITFEDLGVNTTTETSSVTSGGFVFSSAHFHIVGPANPSSAHNGTTFLGEEDGILGLDITMTKEDGGLFSLLGFDGAESLISNAEFPNATSILLTGVLFGGGIVTAEFDLDGIIDGAGGRIDFQTFVLGTAMTDLVSLTFSGLRAGDLTGGISIDNIVVGDAVPVPGAALLMASGLYAFRRFAKKKTA